jgi:hypothetical protein
MTRRYGGQYDPSEMQQTAGGNPFYNPMQPTADWSQGIRAILNGMWGYKEKQRKESETQQQLDIANAIAMRKAAAEETRANAVANRQPNNPLQNKITTLMQGNPNMTYQQAVNQASGYKTPEQIKLEKDAANADRWAEQKKQIDYTHAINADVRQNANDYHNSMIQRTTIGNLYTDHAKIATNLDKALAGMDKKIQNDYQNFVYGSATPQAKTPAGEQLLAKREELAQQLDDTRTTLTKLDSFRTQIQGGVPLDNDGWNQVQALIPMPSKKQDKGLGSSPVDAIASGIKTLFGLGGQSLPTGQPAPQPTAPQMAPQQPPPQQTPPQQGQPSQPGPQVSPPPIPAQPQIKVGTTATNPKTGKRIYWDGSQWIPIK